MPELPEVEITRQRIAPLLVNRQISKLLTTPPSYFFLTPPAVLRKRLVGRTVCSLERKGKYLLAALDDESSLLLHLGMTGQLFSDGAINEKLGKYPDQHTHVTFVFGGGARVFFRDVRKFGKVRWLPKNTTDPRIEKLGVDALHATGAELHSAARDRRVPVKTLLLDQKVLAGIGNIYADEALFLACVHPSRTSRRLKPLQCDALVSHIQDVLTQSIAAGGSTISDFVAPDGQSGSYQENRLIYGREGEPCIRCQSTIRRIVIAQRSSFFCPKCQR